MKVTHPFGSPTSDRVLGKWKAYGVGMDVHKEMVWVCVLKPNFRANDQERVLCKFSTDPTGLLELKAFLESHVPEGHRTFLVESTSTYHFPVMWALPNWTPTVINPALVGSAKRKTDRWDAQTLAHHDMAGTFPTYPLMKWEDYATRQIFRRWFKIQGALRRNLSSLRTRLCLFGLNWDGNLSSDRGWKIFTCLTRMDDADIAYLRCHKEKTALLPFVDIAMAIPPGLGSVHCLQLDELAYLRRESAAVWVLGLGGLDQGNYRLLRSVPHINERVAGLFLGEIGGEEFPMLVFTRSVGDEVVILIPDQAEIIIQYARKDRHGKIILGIEAPPEVIVHRREVWERIKALNLLPKKVPAG